MAYGIQTFDANGQLSFDTNLSISRIIAVVNTGTAPGSIAVPEWANGNAWWVVIDDVANLDFWDSAIGCPEVFRSGNSITWQWYQPTSQFPTVPRAANIIVGVF